MSRLTLHSLTTQLTTIGASSTVSVDHKSAFETASFTKESIQDASPTDTLGRIAPWESHQNRTISEPDFQKGNAEKWTHTTLPALGKQSPSLSDVSSEEGVLVTYERSEFSPDRAGSRSECAIADLAIVTSKAA